MQTLLPVIFVHNIYFLIRTYYGILYCCLDELPLSNFKDGSILSQLKNVFLMKNDLKTCKRYWCKADWFEGLGHATSKVEQFVASTLLVHCYHNDAHIFSN